jgi:hypothetical protein
VVVAAVVPLVVVVVMAIMVGMEILLHLLQ